MVVVGTRRLTAKGNDDEKNTDTRFKVMQFQ